MILDVAQSMIILIMGVVTIAILLKILFIVHKQSTKVKELEMRMKAMENMELDEPTTDNDKIKTEK